ncbi:MAG: flagella basal body P-ring formation protein FlgA [Spirochaetota bacterium]|nr:flagella basal body P-ring formation protein FlgA [Spirochaetota bacterium]
MNRIIVATIIISAFFQSLLFADLAVYLKSNTAPKNNLSISDIAQIDGDESELVKKITIPESVLDDGYITKNEVYQLLKDVVTGLLVIHGSAVKLVAPESISTSDSSLQELSPIYNELVIAKGDLVTVKLIKKSIVIELIGKALQSGKTGDEIKISLQSGKTVTGKIVNNGVECYL